MHHDEILYLGHDDISVLEQQVDPFFLLLRGRPAEVPPVVYGDDPWCEDRCVAIAVPEQHSIPARQVRAYAVRRLNRHTVRNQRDRALLRHHPLVVHVEAQVEGGPQRELRHRVQCQDPEKDRRAERDIPQSQIDPAPQSAG